MKVNIFEDGGFKMKRINKIVMIVILAFISIFVSPLAGVKGGEKLPIPTIEDLTKGKVKIGDLITGDNVDLVKEYLPASIYVCVKQGMVLRMGNNLPPEKLVPKFFLDITERNKGRAVIDENGTVTLADGSPWPGGLPFKEPKNGLEVMANVKFGAFQDDGYWPSYPVHYVNKAGKIYKTAKMVAWQVFTTGRERVSPLGTVPGFEKEQFRHIAGFTYPLELKGLGQLTIRPYDENKYPDKGFVYLPAFKRTIRISATTYQDNMGGQDFTWGDPRGLRDPYRHWKFKLIGKKFMLIPEPHSPIPILMPEDRSLNPEIKTDLGKTFLRIGWAITPVHIVEALPTGKHVYGKKVCYVNDPTFWPSDMPIAAVDIYDRKLKLWKAYWDLRGLLVQVEREPFPCSYGAIMRNLQTGHTTQHFWRTEPNYGTQPEELNLQRLLELGR